MRIVYLGTPEMAVPPLHALVEAGHEIVLVVTRVDKRRGRGSELSPEPREGRRDRARACRCRTRSTTCLTAVSRDGAELGVVVAFGRIIKPHVLDVIPMVNLHFSLLPRWRGAAPVERAHPGRRRRHRRVCDGPGGGPRHRRCPCPPRGAHRRGDHGGGAASGAGRGRLRRCWSTHSPARSRSGSISPSRRPAR